MKTIFFLIACLLVSLVSHSQNVGIGNANPAAKLHISHGYVRIDTLSGIGNRWVYADPTGTLRVSNPGGSIRPYHCYVALISQSGTANPTANVLENYLGCTITWTRTSAGTYTGTLAPGFTFTANKTVVFTNSSSTGIPLGTGQTTSVSGARISNNQVRILMQAGVNAVTDGVTNIPIEIRIYP